MLTLRGPQLQIRNVRVNSKHISQHPTPSLVRHFTSRSVVSITNFRSETPLLVPKPTSETFALSHRLDESVLRKFPPVHSQLLKRGYTSQKKDDDEAAPKTETEEETKDENKATEQDSSKVEAQGEKEKSTDEEEADSKKEEGEENGSGSESTPQLMIFKIKLTEGEDGQTKIEEVNELKPEAKEGEKAQDKTEEEAKPEEEAKKEDSLRRRPMTDRLDVVPVGIADEHRVVGRVVLRPHPRLVQDFQTQADGDPVRLVHHGPVGGGERDV